MARSPEQVRRLEDAVDLRLVQLWGEIREDADWTTELVARFMRSAYGFGYMDALRDKGSLCDEHGYEKP